MHDVVDSDGSGVCRGAVAVVGGIEGRQEPKAAVVETAQLRQDPNEHMI